MADEEMQTVSENPNLEDSKSGDVFVNGNSEKELKSECPNDSENMEYIPTEKILPRKSSFMNKDGSRRNHSRKKTVSFSSMPTERKIATGNKLQWIISCFVCNKISENIPDCQHAACAVKNANKRMPKLKVTLLPEVVQQ